MNGNIKGITDKFHNKEAQIAIVGLGYVGLPLAVIMAEAGFNVIGIDKDEERIKILQSGENLTSDIDSARLKTVLESGKLILSLDFIGSPDAIIICVPTPLNKHREPDISYIVEAAESIVPHLREGQLIVLESTSYPGTTEELIKPRIESRGLEVGKDIYLAFSPERIDPGNKKYPLQVVPKVIGGVTKNCTEVAKALYEEVIQAGVYTVSSPRVAEMTKLLENIFRNVNIALVNELTQLCDRMDINIWEVIEAAKSKPYGFMPFYPGPGVGGHCIPIDPFYLSWKAREYDFQAHFIELAGEVNNNMPMFVVSKLIRLLNYQRQALNGSKILLLGVAYKSDIADTRESPALKLISLLEEEGVEVAYHDPYVPKITVNKKLYKSLPLTERVLQSMDAVVLFTNHSSFDYTFITDHCKILLDTRNAINGSRKNVYKL